MPDISLMVSARDNFTANLSKMGSASKVFQAQLKQLDAQLSLIDRERVTLKVSTDDAKKQLQDARRHFMETGDEMDELAYKEAQLNFDNMTRNLKLAEDSAKQTTKSMKELKDEFNRQQNRADGLMSQLGKAGLSQMAGNVASHALGTFASSALGETMGSAVSSTISSAFSGAAIGSMIAPGVGTAIGAVAGAVVGVFDSAISTFEKKDDAFKSVVQERYEATQQAFADSLSVGSEIAANREMIMKSWKTLFGSESAAANMFSEARELANMIPSVSFDEMASMVQSLKTYGFEQSDIITTLTSTGSATTAMGLNSSDMATITEVLGKMERTQRVERQWIDMLTERGIDAVGWMAEAGNISVGDVYENISKGVYTGKGSELVDLFTSNMTEDYGKSLYESASTFTAATAMLADAKADVEAAYGEGYNRVRMEGMRKEIEFLGSEGGDLYKEGMRKAGEYQAYQENLKMQYETDAFNALTTGDLGLFDGTAIASRLSEMFAQMQELMANGATDVEISALYSEALVIAENEYMASTGYQEMFNSQKNLINQIQSDSSLNSLYYNTGLQLGQELSKGLTSAIQSGVSQAEGALGSISRAGGARGHGAGRGSSRADHSTAWGQRRVPYDNYFTMLHEGERVLTAQEARNADAGVASVSVQVMGNLVVREEADVDAIAARLAEEISLAQSVAI